MSPADAATLLDLPVNASPEQLETRFLELRRKLEDKIAKAPTPGLQAKYRETLAEITTALETLTLAADGSSLPVTQRQSGGGTPSPVRSAQAPALHSKPKSGGKEFILVAIIAVAVLAAGGWFVMKTRADNAEQVRLAAEAKTAAERKAEEARLAAEASRRAEGEEKARIAASEKTEQERREKLLVALRVQLADARVVWSSFEGDAIRAERAAAELRSDLRGATEADARAELEARVAAQTSFASWLGTHLARHPVRTLRAQAEELVSARSADDAAPVVGEMKRLLDALPAEIAGERQKLLVITGALAIESDPVGLRWTMTDAFGHRQTGVTPAELSGVGLGVARVVVSRPGWPDEHRELAVNREGTARMRVEFRAARVELTSIPAGAVVRRGGATIGRTPLEIEVPPGETSLIIEAEGHHAQTVVVTGTDGQPLRREVRLVPLPSAAERAAEAFWPIITSGEWLGKISILDPIGVEFVSRQAANVNMYAGIGSGKTVFRAEVVAVDPVARVIRLRFQRRVIGLWAVGDEAEVRLVNDRSMEFIVLKKDKKVLLTPR